MKLKQSILIIGLICILLAANLSTVSAMAVVALFMALFWIFEVLPLGTTALIPLVAYPYLGIMATKKVAPIYMSSILFLFIGGFLVAIAMERWNLHKRIALTIISVFGSAPKRLVLAL